MPSARRALATAKKWRPSSVWRATTRRVRFCVPARVSRRVIMIRFFCPTCRAKIQAPDDNAGRSGHCPKCQGSFVVPAASAAELAETVSTLGNEIPAVPIPQSSRPASPFEVYGTAQTVPPPPTAEDVQASLEAELLKAALVPTARTAASALTEEETDDQLPPPPPRPKVSTGWLPLALAGAGALLI